MKGVGCVYSKLAFAKLYDRKHQSRQPIS